jgi:hypothetical protein
MKRYLLLAIIIITVIACNKTTTLPSYTPPVAKNFSVTSLNHTLDTVNVGDTIYLSASGVASDSSKNIYTYLSVSSTVSGVSSVYNYGNAASPIKLPKNYANPTNGLYSWADSIMLPGATLVPHKTKLTIVGNFIYQLSLSSEQGTLSATDAGQLNKTVYVQ